VSKGGSGRRADNSLARRGPENLISHKLQDSHSRPAAALERKECVSHEIYKHD
jgi:hypothetical protein